MKLKQKENPFSKNKYEICYHLINSGIAGTLVFLGSLSNGEITIQGISFGVVAALIIFFTKIKSYWKTQEKEYSHAIFIF